MATMWTKKEMTILKENFSTAKWEDLLEMLPNKSEKQILNRAEILGLKRERKLEEIYYDKDKKSWIETSTVYSGIKARISSIIPSPEGTSFEETKEELSSKFMEMFKSRFVLPTYNKIIETFDIDDNKGKIYKIIFKMEKEKFFSIVDKDGNAIYEKYKDKLINAINEEKLKKLRNKKKEGD